MGVGGQAPVMDMEDAMRTLEGFTIDIDPTGGIAVPQIDLTFPSGN